MYEKSLIIKCKPDYKKMVEIMAENRGMNVSEFIRFLIEKQREADRK